MYRLNNRRKTLPQRLSSNSPMTMRELERIALLRRNRGSSRSSYGGGSVTTTSFNDSKKWNNFGNLEVRKFVFKKWKNK